MDMALLRRAGWCESMCARSVLARYGALRGGAGGGGAGAGGGSAPPSPAERDDPVRAARALLRSLPIPSAEFAYGRTKVFIRSPRTVRYIKNQISFTLYPANRRVGRLKYFL